MICRACKGQGGTFGPPWSLCAFCYGLGEVDDDYYSYRSDLRTTKRRHRNIVGLQIWEETLALYHYHCVRCRSPKSPAELTRDHIKPRSKRGSDSIENLQPLCFPCNQYKGTEEIDYRQEFLDWWFKAGVDRLDQARRDKVESG